MFRRNRRLLLLLFLLAAWLLAPELAYADNCSSLNDCYYTLRAALAAAVGLGVFAALMAIGLDVGPLASRLRKRNDGDASPEGAAGDDADVWDRSLGMVSLEGMVSQGMAQAAPPAAKRAPPGRASDQAMPPGEDQASRELPPDTAETTRGTSDRTTDQIRGEGHEGLEGRRAPEADRVGTTSEEGAAGGSGVADRAEEVTRLAGETGEARQGGQQAQQAKRAPDQATASQQGQPPAEAPSAKASPSEARMDQAAPRDERLADHMRSDADVSDAGRRAGEAPDVADSAAGEAGGSDVSQRAQDVASAFEPQPVEGQAGAQGQPPQGSGMAQAEGPADEPLAQAGAQSEGPSPAPRDAGQQAAKPAPAHAGPRPSSAQAQAPPEPASAANADVARDLARAYGDLSQVPGVRLLLQQVAYHGAWAARAAAAQLALARRLAQQGSEGVRLADEGRGADIVTRDGTLIEVKNYYWQSPLFQSEENVAAVTRRLVRQIEILRRRYPDRQLQLAFGDARQAPRQMRLVLQSVGIDIAPYAGAASSDPESIAGASFVSKLRDMTPQQYWEELRACGWQDPEGALVTRLSRAFEHDPAGAWLSLASCAFDAECIYETTPQGESYDTVLRQLSRASEGAFRPQRVAEQVRDDAHLLVFMHGGRRYGVKTPAATDFFSPAVLDVVNRALGESGETRRFWSLPSPDQMLHLAFVEPQAAQRALAAGLIPAPPAERRNE